MSDLKLTLQRKIGPLKGWQWLVALVGLLLVYRFARGGGAAVPLGVPLDTTPGRTPELPDPLGQPEPPIPTPVPLPGRHHHGGGGHDHSGSTSTSAESSSPAPVVQVSAPTPLAKILGQVAPAGFHPAKILGQLPSPSQLGAGSLANAFKAPSSAPAASVRYYTYKADVPLGPGQTLHFTTGKGYYAG